MERCDTRPTFHARRVEDPDPGPHVARRVKGQGRHRAPLATECLELLDRQPGLVVVRQHEQLAVDAVTTDRRASGIVRLELNTLLVAGSRASILLRATP